MLSVGSDICLVSGCIHESDYYTLYSTDEARDHTNDQRFTESATRQSRAGWNPALMEWCLFRLNGLRAPASVILCIIVEWVMTPVPSWLMEWILFIRISHMSF